MAEATEQAVFGFAVERMSLFGYDLPQEDTKTLLFAVKRAIQYALNFCHVEEVSQDMEYAVADIAAAYYLEPLLSIGGFAPAAGTGEVSSIKIGDTTTNFASSGSSPTTLTKATVDGFLTDGRRELCRFRKLLF